MDVRPSLIANTQSSELVQPGEGALDHPPIDAQAAAVFFIASRKNGLDASSAKLFTVRLGIVSPIALHTSWTASRTTFLALKGRNTIHKLQQLGDIMIIGPGESNSQRYTLCVGDQMMFAPGLAAVGGIRPCFFPLPQQLAAKPNLLLHATNRSGRPGGAALTVCGGFSPTPRPFATREAAASRSCPNYSPSPWAPSPMEYLRSAQKECLLGPCDRRGVCDQDSENAGVL